MLDDPAEVSADRIFAITYAPSAPAGLPPVLSASSIFRYADDAGVWFAAVMDAPEGAENATRWCVLRRPASDIATVTEHADLLSAIATLDPSAS